MKKNPNAHFHWEARSLLARISGTCNAIAATIVIQNQALREKHQKRRIIVPIAPLEAQMGK